MTIFTIILENLQEDDDVLCLKWNSVQSPTNPIPTPFPNHYNNDLSIVIAHTLWHSLSNLHNFICQVSLCTIWRHGLSAVCPHVYQLSIVIPRVSKRVFHVPITNWVHVGFIKL